MQRSFIIRSAYAGRYDSRGALHHHALPFHALAAVGIRALVGRAAVRRFSMAEHLHLPCPAKQEQIAEGGIVAPAYHHVQASAHEFRPCPSYHRPARVILHIASHGGEMARIGVAISIGKADGVVVVIIPEGLLLKGKRRVIKLPLLL